MVFVCLLTFSPLALANGCVLKMGEFFQRKFAGWMPLEQAGILKGRHVQVRVVTPDVKWWAAYTFNSTKKWIASQMPGAPDISAVGDLVPVKFIDVANSRLILGYQVDKIMSGFVLSRFKDSLFVAEREGSIIHSIGPTSHGAGQRNGYFLNSIKTAPSDQIYVRLLSQKPASEFRVSTKLKLVNQDNPVFLKAPLQEEAVQTR